MPFIEWINAVVEFLRKTPLVADFTFRDGTRAVAGWIEWPLDLLEGILISGFANGAVPSLPWTMIVGLAAVWGWYLRGWRTRDLGQEIFRALTFNDAGKGLVVGLCVAFMGLTADRLITEWAVVRKRELGIG